MKKFQMPIIAPPSNNKLSDHGKLLYTQKRIVNLLNLLSLNRIDEY